MTEDLVKRARELAEIRSAIENHVDPDALRFKLRQAADALESAMDRATSAELSRDEWKQKAEELSDQLDEAKQLEREMWKDSGAESWAQYAIDLAKDRDEWKAKAEKAGEALREIASAQNYFAHVENVRMLARSALASLGLASGKEGGGE